MVRKVDGEHTRAYQCLTSTIGTVSLARCSAADSSESGPCSAWTTKEACRAGIRTTGSAGVTLAHADFSVAARYSFPKRVSFKSRDTSRRCTIAPRRLASSVKPTSWKNVLSSRSIRERYAVLADAHRMEADQPNSAIIRGTGISNFVPEWPSRPALAPARLPAAPDWCSRSTTWVYCGHRTRLSPGDGTVGAAGESMMMSFSILFTWSHKLVRPV
mmetsp:Transcript_25291/g.66120  ORF Transcript_25291/g.66120 Transcript_25291/m.66120 type:complete len:216 (+) Transcript_25291:702-1349(+)